MTTGEGMEVVACALCGGDDTAPVFQVRDLHFTVDQRRDRVFTLVRCRTCGLVYVNPRPTREELPAYHPAEFYYAYRPIEPPRWRGRVRAACKAWTAEAHFGYPTRTGPLVQLLKWVATYPIKRRLTRIVPHNQPGRLLDVGCGNGAFLYWMREHSTWEVQGVEPSPVGAAYAREVLGLNVITGTLRDAKFPPDHFDVVTFFDSFMHVPDPVETLMEVRRILKPGGVVTLVLPNIESREARAFGPYWFMLDVPRHLYYYSPRTIAMMVERGGLRLRRITFPGGVERPDMEFSCVAKGGRPPGWGRPQGAANSIAASLLDRRPTGPEPGLADEGRGGEDMNRVRARPDTAASGPEPASLA